MSASDPACRETEVVTARNKFILSNDMQPIRSISCCARSSEHFFLQGVSRCEWGRGELCPCISGLHICRLLVTSQRHDMIAMHIFYVYAYIRIRTTIATKTYTTTHYLMRTCVEVAMTCMSEQHGVCDHMTSTHRKLCSTSCSAGLCFFMALDFRWTFFTDRGFLLHDTRST